jgi:hypothetical protein
MNHAVISGDIIASTSLNDLGKAKIEAKLNSLIKELNKKYGIYGRVLKGDYIECYVKEIADVFRVALAIKSFVKSVEISSNEVNPNESGRLKLFKTYGIRLAIGVGELSRLDLKNGIIDGDAIYFSGRIINEDKTHNKEKVTIKNTLFIKSNDDEFDREIQPLLALIDVLISKNTQKQCEVLYLKLIGLNEESIVKKLKKKQPTINEQSTIAGWNAIEKAVQRFEYVVKNKTVNHGYQ